MIHEVKFLSYNQRDQVYGWIYAPACQPKGVVQLVHGFGEHSRRYLHMIVQLMEAGLSLRQTTMWVTAKPPLKTTPGAIGVPTAAKP